MSPANSSRYSIKIDEDMIMDRKGCIVCVYKSIYCSFLKFLIRKTFVLFLKNNIFTVTI